MSSINCAIHLKMFISCFVSSLAACTSLIANNGNVKFSASTSAVGPGFPHVNSNDVWCASVINDEQYLQVDLGNNVFSHETVIG